MNTRFFAKPIATAMGLANLISELGTREGQSRLEITQEYKKANKFFTVEHAEFDWLKEAFETATEIVFKVTECEAGRSTHTEKSAYQIEVTFINGNFILTAEVEAQSGKLIVCGCQIPNNK